MSELFIRDTVNLVQLEAAWAKNFGTIEVWRADKDEEVDPDFGVQYNIPVVDFQTKSLKKFQEVFKESLASLDPRSYASYPMDEILDDIEQAAKM